MGTPLPGIIEENGDAIPIPRFFGENIGDTIPFPEKWIMSPFSPNGYCVPVFSGL
jgi:hypothetical protein